MWQVYYTPTGIDEAVRLLAEHGPQARIVAGGTDLLVEMRHGVRQPHTLIDVTRIAGLDRIELDGEGMLHVGPAVTHNQAVASPLLRERGFPLALTCWRVATPQLRNRGTIAGNLITASPANDTIAALWALDARLTLRSVRGERTLSFADFYQGVRRTALAPDEMVTDIAFPALSPNQRGVFIKLGLRRLHAIPVVNAAVVLTFDGEDSGRVSAARITMGSVAPTIVRAREAEDALIGQPLSDELIAEAGNLAVQSAACIDDIRGSAEYRRDMVRVLVQRALSTLQRQAERDEFPAAPPLLWGRSTGYAPWTGGSLMHQDGGAEPIVCMVNGREQSVRGANHKSLLDMLREDLGLTGSKEGCNEGECGACTVWMDGIAVLGCLIPAPRAHGTAITTVEGLAHGETLHPLQQAFVDEGAVQCGYCTPGFVMSGAKLLEEWPHPEQEQIVHGLSGNLCRCTGYYRIIRAVERAAES